MSKIETVKKYAREFANEINSNPAELQNWGKLESTDSIPEGDYVEITAEFGEFDREMEVSYKNEFNKIINV